MDNMLDIFLNYRDLILTGSYPDGPLGGLALTLFVAATGLVCAFPLAIIIGIARTSKFKLFYLPATLFSSVVRGLPVLMLVFWSYFAVPLISGHSISGVKTLIVALIIYEVAFLGEIVRAGILSVPRGQVEAARTLGISYSRTMLEIILPQALFTMIPSILNQFINLIKNTSLGYVIGVAELTYSAYQINTLELTKPLQVFGVLAMIYFGVCFSLTQLVGKLERVIRRKRQMNAQES
ncbi:MULTISPECIES: amino acid ABC transporter permease [Lonsdalea]|uniref:Amino acid ABC transporter permease n=1 Tax=Lonsdalea populi TaxID=1172565 RepID=A0A3N0UC67_9GAMM|nr:MULTISPECIES: amino acid ABC transporter permease [Lonsdalea]ROH76576.1 amino acid ABC transporter permease [Lonsdalea populi]ROH78143.1 amino acid ABC transporter permease [Lonsdalea populi]ROH78661.1 amino acid ABC transporter permease [Lonsdalea populi]